jgi:hypothetical protein
MFARVNVFLECRKCGHQHCIDGVPPRRVDLALFRGSEHPMPCAACKADMDTMNAYCRERVGSKIIRREDPKY